MAQASPPPSQSPPAPDPDLQTGLQYLKAGWFDRARLLPTQRDLETVTASEIDVYRREGQFAEGSMGPKVKAALNFIAAGGKRAIIAHLDQGADALKGKTGTHVVPG